jgi:hypothetical protein
LDTPGLNMPRLSFLVLIKLSSTRKRNPMNPKSQSKSKNRFFLWSLFLATRTRRFVTIAATIIAICTIALATLSLAQTEKRIERATSAAQPANKIAKPERATSSKASDRSNRRLLKFRDQDKSSLNDQSDRSNKNRDGKLKEWKLKRARPFNGDLRHLPQTKPIKAERPEREGPEPNPSRFVPPGQTSAPERNESTETPNTTLSAPSAPAPPPTSSFEGLDFNTWGNGHPPDTVGDVGPTYYIQAINTSIGIFDKATGNLVTAFTFNTLMSQGHFGNLCDTNNFGDPVILYDTFEDRWVITDFAFQLSGGAVVSPPGSFQCFAVSRSGDPVAGGWNYYSINITDFLNDYPKFGIWPDGIYMSANMFAFPAGGTFQGPRAWAFNKAQMYAGAPTVQSVSFDGPAADFTVIPSNARLSSGTPPPGTPNYFLSTWRFLNAVTVYKFHVDWDHLSLSTFTGPDIPIAATSWPNQGVANAPSQGGNNLDVLQIRAMMQNQYTNQGGVESLWVPHTVRRVLNGFAAPRFYQVPVTGGTVGPNITQAATFDPDGANVINRFMPSLAVDRAGNMALGYSTSSSTTKPAIKYAGRLATDPINTFSQTEQVLIQGAGTQTGNCGGAPCIRWGDYSAMTVDPDGCTFWYTNMYYPVDGLNHHTRIASFGLPQCTPAVAGALQGTVTSSSGGGPISGATISLGARTTTTDASGFYSFPNLEPGTYPSITATFPGYTSSSFNSIVVSDGNITTQDFVLSPGDNPSCLTDTTQLDFQRGVSTNIDLLTSPGDARLPDAPRIDQQNTNVTTSGFGFNSTAWAGQTFTAGVTGDLTRVDLDLFCSGCTGTTPNITVSIRATAGSPAVPTGADLASATIPGFSSGAGGYFSANFASPLAITAGTRYAVIMRPVANPSAGIYAYVVSSANPYPNGQRITSADSGVTWVADITSGGRDLGFKVFVKTGFPPSGTLTSGIFDANPYAGGTANWTTMSWNATVPDGTSLQFQVAGSNSVNGPFNFVGPDGTSGTFFTTSGASLAQFNGLRYLKYEAFFATTDSTQTPTLNDVTLCNSNTVPTSISVGSATGTYGGTVNLSATLTDGTSPLSGKTINFSLNGNSVGNAVTDSSGIATLNNASLAGINAGSYPTGVGASFAGDTTYLGSNTTNSLIVNRADAVISVTGYNVQYNANPHTATGTATGVNGESLAGLDLSGTTHTNAGNYAGDPWTFTDVTGNYNNTSGTVDDAISKAPSSTNVVCPTSVQYTGSPLTPCTATATGVGNLNASVNVSYTNNVDPGTATANATYAGDPNHDGSSGSGHFTITALPVKFVIGNLNAVVGQKVTFWGSQWGKQNFLSGSSTPSGFKGLATTTSTNPASCGGTWSSIAGDTGAPASVPRFITIMVASSATKSGTTINGNITKLVIIKVDPGYGSDPAIGGTGTVYSVVCP